MTPELFNQLARSRRSVFPDQLVQGKKVDDAIVREIITNGLWAPNHGLAEPWLFTVFTGEGLQKLADFQAECYKETTPNNFKQATYDKLKITPQKASHVIAIGLKKTPNPNIPEMEDIAAVSCAVQNIALGVTAYGLGGYWTSGGITYREAAKPFFGLEPQDKLLGFFYLGYVAVASAPGKRAAFESKVSWID